MTNKILNPDFVSEKTEKLLSDADHLIIDYERDKFYLTDAIITATTYSEFDKLMRTKLERKLIEGGDLSCTETLWVKEHPEILELTAALVLHRMRWHYRKLFED